MNERSFIVKRMSARVNTNPAIFEHAFFRRMPRIDVVVRSNCAFRRRRSARRMISSAGAYLILRSTSPWFVSRFRTQHCFDVMRHNRHRLRRRVEAGERIRNWLPDELHDRGEHAQNARGIHRRFHYPPALLLRVHQEPVY